MLSKSHFQTLQTLSLTKPVNAGHQGRVVESPAESGREGAGREEGLQVYRSLPLGIVGQGFLAKVRKEGCGGRASDYAQLFLTTSTGLPSAGKCKGNFKKTYKRSNPQFSEV